MKCLYSRFVDLAFLDNHIRSNHHCNILRENTISLACNLYLDLVFISLTQIIHPIFAVAGLGNEF